MLDLDVILQNFFMTLTGVIYRQGQRHSSHIAKILFLGHNLSQVT